MIIYYIGGPIGLGTIFLFFLVSYLMFGDTEWIFTEISDFVADKVIPPLYFILFLLAILSLTVFCIHFVKKNKKLLFPLLPLWLLLTNTATLVYLDNTYDNFTTDSQQSFQQTMGYKKATPYLARLYKASFSNLINITEVNEAFIQKIYADEADVYGDTSFSTKTILTSKYAEFPYFDAKYYYEKYNDYKLTRIYLPDNYKNFCLTKRGFATNYCSTIKIMFDKENWWLVEAKPEKLKKRFIADCYPKYSINLKCPCWIKDGKEVPAVAVKLKTKIIE